MVATVGGCPFNGAKCSVRWAMFAAFLSVACAMPLSHMNNDDYINTISIKHSGPAVAAVCEAVAVDTVFFKTPSPPQGQRGGRERATAEAQRSGGAARQGAGGDDL